MKIHSDTLTFQDISDAVPKGCYLAEHFHRERQVTIGQEGSRKRQRGYIVRLSGSSKVCADSRCMPEVVKAATWDEWGVFIAELFKRDPKAIVGHYKTRDDFISITTDEHNRIKLYRQDLAPTHRAPWLAHN